VGRNVSYTVRATSSTPLSYQWEFRPAGSSSWSSLLGETGNTLRMTKVASGRSGSYRVVVSNSGGSVTSRTVSLEVR
jgi:hypothetical protein